MANRAKLSCTAKRFTAIAAFCLLFGAVYECFGHGVYSVFMLGAFIVPLLFGALPAWILSKRDARPRTAARWLWYIGVALLTVGSILQGVVEIYGTTNRLIALFPVAAAVVLAAAFAARRLPRRRVSRRTRTWTAIAAVTAVAGLTFYVLADCFLIARRFSDATPTEPADEPRTAAVVTDTTYSDEHIQIVIRTVREFDTDVYLADVTVSDASYLKTAFADNTFGKNVTAETSVIAESVGAILAINGDGYGVQENGFVIRNGRLYRGTVRRDQQDLLITKDGRFEIIDESGQMAKTLLDAGAWQVLSFGPPLLQNGASSVIDGQEVAVHMTSNPRTAIGMIEPNHFLFLVSDGRTDDSKGLSLYELAKVFRQYGARVAYNLDGGGSSVMVFNGRIVNKPTTYGTEIKERAVSDIVYIG